MVHIALKTLKKWEKEGFVIMVSGGIDSMVLLDLCRMYHPHILHFDHQAREESIQDHELLLNYSKKHRLVYHQITLNIPKKNFQHEAHLLRQAHAIEYAKTNNLKHVLTAHHADDLIETMLIKMIRGSHLEGYIGMKAEHLIDNVVFHKPLLTVTKDDVIDYAKDHLITFMEDRTNLKDDYLRNRLRHHVIPLLKEENSSLHTSFSKLSTTLYEAHSIILQKATSFLSMTPWSITQFKALERSVQKEVISLQLKAHHVSPTYPLVQSLLNVLLGTKPNVKLSLDVKLDFIRTYDTWQFVKPITNKKEYFTLTENEALKLNNMIFTYFHNPFELPSNAIKICYNQLAFPLILRHRQDGDLLSFSFGHKKLKSLLIDQKIPVSKRDQLWILTDQNHTILWVQDLYINQTLGQRHTLYIHTVEVTHAS